MRTAFRTYKRTTKEELESKLLFLQMEAKRHITNRNIEGQSLKYISEELLKAIELAKRIPETEDFRDEDEKTFGIRE